MPHSICSTAQGGELPYLQRLWSTLLTSDLNLDEKLEQLLAAETAEFGLESAFVSRVDTDAETEYFEIVHGPHGSLEAGNTVPLSETYCRKTIAEPEGALAVSDALAEGWDGDPAYERFGLGSYVGTTVSVDDELYGTLCFASTSPRAEPISEAEVALVEMHSDWLSYELNQSARPSFDSSASVSHDIRSPEIDSMMDALSKPARRLILQQLLEDTTRNSVDVRRRFEDVDDAETQLHHVHLPKLAGYGYIEWDRDSSTVSRGPKFSDIERLLRSLGVSPE